MHMQGGGSSSDTLLPVGLGDSAEGSGVGADAKTAGMVVSSGCAVGEDGEGQDHELETRSANNSKAQGEPRLPQ